MSVDNKPGFSVLAVFAHPDDESCGPGGTLARWAAEGGEVTLLCLTRGEMGGAPEPDKRSDALLGEIRSRELEAACRELGIRRCIIRDFPDGLLHQSDPKAFKGEVLAAIGAARPTVIITSDPTGRDDEDHTIVARATAAAVGAAARLGRLSPPFTLLHYYVGPAFDDLRRSFDVVRVDVSRYRERKAAALRCHVTQSNCTWGPLRHVESETRIFEQFLVGHSVPAVRDDLPGWRPLPSMNEADQELNLR